MERVLVTGAANIGKAGVATIVYKWGQQFDSSRIVYDYLMQSGLPERKYQDAIRKKGGIIYTLDEKKRTMLGIIKWVQDIIEKHNYKVLHINSDSAYIAAAYIFAAKKAGIERIYVHSHCTQIDENNRTKRFIKTAMHKICKPYVIKNTDMYLACSKLAGKWMFGEKNTDSEKYKTIFNGVEVERYLYDENIRRKYRKELNFENSFIIGNIGRFSYQKNQEFLVEVFSRFQQNYPNSKLVFVGEGELENLIREKVDMLGLTENVVFLGLRKDVPSLLSAFDVMVMPSRFEGLPVTMVEAQMASLPLIVSSNITEESNFTGDVSFVNGWDYKNWIATLENTMKRERILNKEYLLSCDFNAKNATCELQKILLGEYFKC